MKHKYSILIVVFFLTAFLNFSCVTAKFGEVSLEEEKKNHQDLIAELEKANLEEIEASAERGDSNSQIDLALLYIFGVQVEQDYASGVEWLEKSAAADNFIGMYNLGLAHYKGIGSLSKSSVEAYKWMLLAQWRGYRQPGAKLITNVRKQIEKTWLFVKRKRIAEAHELKREWIAEKYGGMNALIAPIELRGAHKDAVASFRVAKKFHYGEGVPIDYIYAYAWYTLALIPEGYQGVSRVKPFLSPEETQRAKDLAAKFRTGEYM